MTLDRMYAACLAFADACERRRLLVFVLGAPAYTLLLVVLGRLVLQDFPNSGDEYAYLFEAATLRRGRLSNPAPPFAEFFAFNYIAHDNGRTFGTFPPGWPLALAAAMWVHVPAWLVNPLLGTASLVMMWALARELHGPRTAALASAITAASAFFMFNAASYFSHTFCGVLLLAAAYLAVLSARSHVAFPLLLGFAVGWAVVTRYFTGVIGGIVIAALVVRMTWPRSWRPLLFVAIGGVPWIVFLLAYNGALSGTPLRLTTQDSTVSLWFARGFALRGLDILSTQLLQFILWTPPALLIAYLWYLRRARPADRRGPIDWLFVLTAIALVFYVNRGGNQYGPRFYYEAFLFLVVFTAASLFREDTLAQKDRVGRGLFAAMAVSVAAAPLVIALHAWHVRTVIRERMDPFTHVTANHVTNAVVLLGGRIGTVRSIDARDLTRNGTDYSRDVLFALDRGRTENCRLAAAMTSRSFYVYAWDGLQRQGRLSELQCP